MKTSELTGVALDWAVCVAEYGYGADYKTNLYSTDWSHGGPIIDREAITVSEGSPVVGLEWMACDRGSTHIQHGPTYLIAAMRCYVASKLGDDLEVPDELY
jgi:hypothetical protein